MGHIAVAEARCSSSASPPVWQRTGRVIEVKLKLRRNRPNPSSIVRTQSGHKAQYLGAPITSIHISRFNSRKPTTLWGKFRSIREKEAFGARSLWSCDFHDRAPFPGGEG